MMVVTRTAAQDGAVSLQHNYRTLLDNEQMQVVRVHYNPHEALRFTTIRSIRRCMST
jgi:hypothetical protein